MSNEGDGTKEAPDILIPVIMIHPPPEEVSKVKNVAKRNLPPIVSKGHPVHGRQTKKNADVQEETFTSPARKYIQIQKYSEAADVLVSLLPENKSSFEKSVEIYHLLLKCYTYMNEVEKHILASFDFFLKFSNNVLLDSLPRKFFEFLKWVKTQRRSVLSSMFPPHPDFAEEKQNLVNDMFESGQVKCENIIKKFSKFATKPIEFARNLIRKRKSREKSDPAGMKTIGRLFGCLYRSLKGMAEKFPIVRSQIEIACMEIILQNGLVKTGEKDEEGVSGMMMVRFAANTFPHYLQWEGCSESVEVLAKSSIKLNSCDTISCEKYYYFYQLLPLLKGRRFSNIFPMTQEGFRLSLSDPANPNYTYSRVHGTSFYLWKYLMRGKSWKFFDDQVEYVKHESPLFNETISILSRLDEALRGERRTTRWASYEFVNPEVNDEIPYYGRFLLNFVKGTYLFLVGGDPLEAGEALAEAGRWVRDAHLLEEIHYRFFQGVLAGRNLEDLKLEDPGVSGEIKVERDRLSESLDFFTKLEKCNPSFFEPFFQYVQAESQRWEENTNTNNKKRNIVDNTSKMYLQSATSFQRSGNLLLVGVVLERRLRYVREEGFSIQEFEGCLKSSVKAWSDLNAPLMKKRVIRVYGSPSPKLLQRIEEEDIDSELMDDEDEEELELEIKVEEEPEAKKEFQKVVHPPPLKIKVPKQERAALTPQEIEEKERASSVVGRIFDQLRSPEDERKQKSIFQKEEEKKKIEPIPFSLTPKKEKKKKKILELGLSLPDDNFVSPTPLSIGGNGILDNDSLFDVVSEKKDVQKEKEEKVKVKKLEEIIEVGSTRKEEPKPAEKIEEKPIIVKSRKENDDVGSSGLDHISRIEGVHNQKKAQPQYLRLPGGENNNNVQNQQQALTSSQQQEQEQPDYYPPPTKARATSKFLRKFVPFMKSNKLQNNNNIMNNNNNFGQPQQQVGLSHQKFVSDLQQTLLQSCFSRYEFLNKQLGLFGYLFPKSMVSQIVEERQRAIQKFQQQEVKRRGMVRHDKIPPPAFRIRKIGKFLVQDRFLHDFGGGEEELDEDVSFLNSSIVFYDPELQRKRVANMMKNQQRRKLRRMGYKVHELYEIFEPKMYRKEVLTIYDRMQRLFLERKFAKVMQLYMDSFTMNDHLHPKDRRSKTQNYDNSTTHRTKLHQGSSVLQKTMFILGKAKRGMDHWGERVERQTMMNWRGEQLCKYIYVVSKLFRQCQLPTVWKGEIPVGWDGRPKMFGGQVRPPKVHPKAGKGNLDVNNNNVDSESVKSNTMSVKKDKNGRSMLIEDDDDDFFNGLEKEEAASRKKKSKMNFLDFDASPPTSDHGDSDSVKGMYNRLNQGILKKKTVPPVELSSSLSEAKRKIMDDQKQRKLAQEHNFQQQQQQQQNMEQLRQQQENKAKKSLEPFLSGMGKLKTGISTWIQKKKNKKKNIKQQEDSNNNNGVVPSGNNSNNIFKKWFGGSSGDKKRNKKRKKNKKDAELVNDFAVGGVHLHQQLQERSNGKKKISQLEMRRRAFESSSSPPLFSRGRNKIVPASTINNSNNRIIYPPQNKKKKKKVGRRNQSFLAKLRNTKNIEDTDNNEAEKPKSSFKAFLEQREKKRKRRVSNINDLIEKKR